MAKPLYTVQEVWRSNPLAPRYDLFFRGEKRKTGKGKCSEKKDAPCGRIMLISHIFTTVSEVQTLLYHFDA